MTPKIHLLAHADADPSYAFVHDPSQEGRYIRAHVCVVHVDCPHCGAMPGEPCHDGKPVLKRTYNVSHHYARLQRWKAKGRKR